MNRMAQGMEAVGGECAVQRTRPMNLSDDGDV